MSATRRRIAVGWVLLSGAAWVCACACDAATAGRGIWVGVIVDTDILSRLDHFRVWAYDSAVQRCAGDTVSDPRAPALASTGDLTLADTAELMIPAGERTFYAEAYGGPGARDVIATGCAERAVAAGERVTVVIRLAESGDGGDADGDADAIDAAADETDVADDSLDDAADIGTDVDQDAGTDADDGADDGRDAADDGVVSTDGTGDVYFTSTFTPHECFLWATASVRGVSDWQCGRGADIPDNGHDDSGGVMGTVIGGDYSPRSDGYAESPPIDASGGSGPLRLAFWHWMQTEAWDSDCTGTFANDDGGMVEVAGGGSGFTNEGVRPFGSYPYNSLDAYFSGGSAHVDGKPGFACRSGDPRPPPSIILWERECFDLSAFRAPDLRIRFYFGSGVFGFARGWYIDQVVVEDGVCP